MNAPRPGNVPDLHSDSWNRLSEYVSQKENLLVGQLGWGNEGLVYSTKLKTAIKAYLHDSLYENERNVYVRLLELNVRSVGRFKVPQLIDHSDTLKIVEMSIVSPPFILDFAGAYLDKKPPFDLEQWEEWEREKAEQFEERWDEIRSALSIFRRHGIYVNDVKPGNVEFGD